MNIKALLLVTVAAIAIPVISNGHPEENEGQHTRREKIEERFAKTDTNGDNQLSFEEVQAAKTKRMAKNFDKIDTDGDGQLSRDELKAARKKMKDKRKELRGLHQ